MSIWIRIGFPLVAGVTFSSCTTRTFCVTHAPPLPPARDRVAGESTQESRVGRYVIGQNAKDGFRVEEIRAIRELPVCGNPLMAPALSLGLLPARLPCPTQVTVAGRIGSVRFTRTYDVSLESYTSLWLAVVPKSHDDRALARGLLGAMKCDTPLPLGANAP